MKLRRNTTWLRDTHNPVLPPSAAESADSSCCMNPWAVRAEDGSLRLYYAGGDAQQHRRICCATTSGDVTSWRRRGPLFDLGPAGSFDAAWCVLPHLVRAGEQDWRIYYTGNSGEGESLARFPGLGVALSADGETFAKYERNPIIPALHQDGAPDAQGIAGGSVLRVRTPNGAPEWRFYYTGCPTLGDDVFLDQQKAVCLAVSADGLDWERRGAVMRRDPLHDYENIAVAGPVVRQRDDGAYQMWYSAIGTRWGYYSICYAESDDGLTWCRGEEYGDNLQLGPTFGTGGWESQMVEYPSVVDEPDGGLRLFYCGNGYGRTGIGTATSAPLRATRGGRSAHVVHNQTASSWDLDLPASITVGDRVCELPQRPQWQGPDAAGTVWYEASLAAGSAGEAAVDVRAMIQHTSTGLDLRLTLMNTADTQARDVRAGFGARPIAGPIRRLAVEWDDAPIDLAPGSVAVVTGTVRV